MLKCKIKTQMNKRNLWEKTKRWAERRKAAINERLQRAAGKAGRRDKRREQGDMETGVEESENWSSETCVCRPDDQTPRSSSTAPVPKLSISNSHMWIFICADIPKAKRPNKIDLSTRIPEEPNLSWRKTKVRNEIKLCRRSPCCQMKKTEMQMFFCFFLPNNAIGRNILNVWSDLWPHHWGISSGLWKKLYFPLRSSLNIRYIKTETLTCVEHIYSNVMFWYSLATSGFSDVPNQKCFLSVSLLKFRSQQNFTNRKVIKVRGLSCGCLHRQRVQSRISVFWSLLLQFYLKFHQAGLNFQ